MLDRLSSDHLKEVDWTVRWGIAAVLVSLVYFPVLAARHFGMWPSWGGGNLYYPLMAGVGVSWMWPVLRTDSLRLLVFLLVLVGILGALPVVAAIVAGMSIEYSYGIWPYVDSDLEANSDGQSSGDNLA